MGVGSIDTNAILTVLAIFCAGSFFIYLTFFRLLEKSPASWARAGRWFVFVPLSLLFFLFMVALVLKFFSPQEEGAWVPVAGLLYLTVWPGLFGSIAYGYFVVFKNIRTGRYSKAKTLCMPAFTLLMTLFCGYFLYVCYLE